MKKIANIKHALLAVLTAFVVLIFGICLSACDDKYKNMTLTLSQTNVVVSLNQDGTCVPTTVSAFVDAPSGVSKKVVATCESAYLQFSYEDLVNGQIITITAVGVCTEVPVVVKTLEGGKTATFYVSVVLPVESLVGYESSGEYYAVKGIEKELIANNLIMFSPQATTQRNVDFSIEGFVPENYARIQNNKLLIFPEYPDSTISIVATSADVSSISTTLIFNVIEPISTSQIECEAEYIVPNDSTVGGAKIDLTKKIELSRNLQDKQSMRVILTIPTTKSVLAQCVVTNQTNASQQIVDAYKTDSVQGPDKVQYTFDIRAQANGTAKIEFKLSYEQYEYSVMFGEFEVEVSESLNKFDLYANGNEIEEDQPHFIVYNEYEQGAFGLALSFKAYPETLSTEKKQLILQLNNLASNLEFFDKDHNKIAFSNNEYVFNSTDTIFIRALYANVSNMQITIKSYDNPAIKRIITLESKQGTKQLEFNSTSTIFLTSNKAETVEVGFSMDTNDTSTLSILTNGKSFSIDTTIYHLGANQYKFRVTSIEGKPDEEAYIILKQANGYTAKANVEVFYAIVKDEISYNIPNAQKNSAVGEISRDVVTAIDSWQFSVAIKQNSSVTIGYDCPGIKSVNYEFAEFLPGTSGYNSLLTGEITDGALLDIGGEVITNLVFGNTTTVINPYMLKSVSQIKTKDVGKVIVRATAEGYIVQNGTRIKQSYVNYFMIETYIPINSISLSKSDVKLYAQNTLGAEDFDQSMQEIVVNMNEDATYKNIAWTGRIFDYQVKMHPVYLFEILDDINQNVKITAFSTYYTDSNGELIVKDSLDFVFMAEIKEFSKEYKLSLNVRIIRAQQVEKISLTNVNVQEGIYIPLTYTGETIMRPVTATVLLGESGIIPHNQKLVYEFLPNFVSSGSIASISDTVSIDKDSGLITVSKDAQYGIVATVRVAPADRYIAGEYKFNRDDVDTNEEDVAVYFKLVIADGRSRATSYQITSFADMDNFATGENKFKLHYTIVANQLDVSTSKSYVLSIQNTEGEDIEFSGGLYGAFKDSNKIVTIITNKPLFYALSANAIVEDLIIVGNVTGDAFLAKTNKGNIRNVVVDCINSQSSYTPSTLTANVNDKAVGGIVGTNLGTISNCLFSGVINAGQAQAFVGGVAGINEGTILDCGVEFYTFNSTSNKYGKIDATWGTIGGLVGQMNDGSLLNSYIYSYISVDAPVELLNSERRGVLVGEFVKGTIDVCFGSVADIADIFGKNTSLTTRTVLKNAYINYYDNATSSIKQIANNKPTESDSIWDLSGTLACFKTVKQSKALSSIPKTFQMKSNNVVSTPNNAVLFYYEINDVLQTQEKVNLAKLNTIYFADLFDSVDNQNSYGIRAISSDSRIVQVTANSLILRNPGKVTLTFFSKFNADIAEEYTIYVVYPISNVTIVSDGRDLKDSYVVNVKTTNGFKFYGKVDTQILLDNQTRTYLTNNLKFSFSNHNAYITGSGLGTITLNTLALFDAMIEGGNLSGQTTLNYAIEVSEVANSTQINEILATKFSGYFNLNLYNGADSLEIATTEVTLEPEETVVVDVVVYSDISYEEGENVVVNFAGKNDYPTDLFDAEIKHISSKHFTSSAMTQTSASSTGGYYAHYFSVILSVNDRYKATDFGYTTFDINFIAKSSLASHENYLTAIVQQTFALTVCSQQVEVITMNHYDETRLPVIVSEGTSNFLLYSFNTNLNNAVTNPGVDGLLEIDLYPSYAQYDYVELTYTTVGGEDGLMYLGLLEKYSNGLKSGYRQTLNGFTNIPNGIRIYNPYANYDGSLAKLFVSTYVSKNVTHNLTFVLTATAYKNGVSVVMADYNLVVQYYQGAELIVCDDDGNSLIAIARGSTANLYIKIQKDQTLDTSSVEIRGVSGMSDASSLKGVNLSDYYVMEDNFSRIYVYRIYVGDEAELVNNSNYITISASISWLVNGVTQKKTASVDVAIVDFVINEISLLTDRADKTSFYSYIGVQTDLRFDFDGNKNASAKSGSALDSFLSNFSYITYSGVNSFGNYIVNYGQTNQTSFVGNLYYMSGDSWVSMLRNDGTFVSNNMFTIGTRTDADGKTYVTITGKRLAENGIKMLFRLPIQYPNANEIVTKLVQFEFTIYITQYSSEDMPLIIDNEQAFYDALGSETENGQDYILMADLYLKDYIPYNTNAISSLDGNNFTINIQSFAVTENQTTIKHALFDNVSANTTLKNLTVNIYDVSNVSVDTALYTSVQIAGLAITNSGIIYNCQVVAYKTEKSPLTVATPGMNVSYIKSSNSVASTIAGFVISNKGYITNSRVGGEGINKVLGGIQNLQPFNIIGQGNISGFVDSNDGYIASSFFANGDISNTTEIGTTTATSGFVRENLGNINSSYSKGVGKFEYSLIGGGIKTASVGAGFVYYNNGTISDAYSNILLANIADSMQSIYESGRLSAGFVYNNAGTITNCYTASKIEKAKSTQMSFVGIDDTTKLLNTGKIDYCYYYNEDVNKENAYLKSNANLNIVKLNEPNLVDDFYGFCFADSSASKNGVWYMTAYGPELVSANQIAISSRYITNEEWDANTHELIKYDLPYRSGFEYGSEMNPIIIRNAEEFNRVFGGDEEKPEGEKKVGTAVASYYDYGEKYVFGNYRLVSNIDLSQLSPDGSQRASVSSTQMTLNGGIAGEKKGGIIDGNMLTILNVDIGYNSNSKKVASFGLFAGLKNNACIMNLNLAISSVNASQTKYVGGLAGIVENSKLVNINITNVLSGVNADISGKNAVGGLVGIVRGNSQIGNIKVSNLNAKASAELRENFYERNNDYLNDYVCYAGGVIGVADIYTDSEKLNLTHKLDMQKANISNIKVYNDFEVYGSIAGGLIGYLGPQTYLVDTTLQLGNSKNQKIISYGLYAGGIVGECHGNIDMARAEHENELQKMIENNVSTYYHNLTNGAIERGNMTLFKSTPLDQGESTYSPKAIGGLVGYLSTGSIYHSYSKVNVINSKATFAGGVVGMIDYIVDAGVARNTIEFYEVYAFGDVFAGETKNDNGQFSSASGGIVGFIDCNRQLIMTKVNAVNYWSMQYNNESKEYYLPENIYEIYAMTGSSITGQNILTLDQLATYEKSSDSSSSFYVSLKVLANSNLQTYQKLDNTFVYDTSATVIPENAVVGVVGTESTFTLVNYEGKQYYVLTEGLNFNNKFPIITCAKGSKDMFAVSYIKTSAQNYYLKQSYARLSGGTMYNMVNDPNYGLQERSNINATFSQSIIPYFDLTQVESNGRTMDAYFIQGAGWDSNYWTRYASTNDLLPSLVTYNESMTFYIDVASDLQKMVLHPNGTFIVRAQGQPSTIIKVGTYIENTGLSLENFTGVLKEYDKQSDYGFDFEGKSSFIVSTSGASFYNLVIKNLGTQGENLEISPAFIETATLSSFENLVFQNCNSYSVASSQNSNIGILANKMKGGYVSNVAFENCVINVSVGDNLMPTTAVNVGMLAGIIETDGNSFIQLVDVCAYQTGQAFTNNGQNNIYLSANGKAISEFNVGTIAGQTIGSIVANYTSNSAVKSKVNGIGIQTTTSKTYSPDSVFNEQYKGTKITLSGTGSIETYNAGMLFGKVGTLNLAFSRANEAQKLMVVGGINQDITNGTSVVEKANLGGLVGIASNNISVTNSSDWEGKYINVDVDIVFLNANVVNAGMLIGKTVNINAIENIDTYGSIQVLSSATTENSNIGGLIGYAATEQQFVITQAISRTSISFVNGAVNIGGLIGYFASTNGELNIGDDNYSVKFLGVIAINGLNLSVDEKEVNIGGILGASAHGSASRTYIKKAVFGGEIYLEKSAQTMTVGGIVGNAHEGMPTTLVENLAYGNISLKYDIQKDSNENINIYLGGLVGVGSAMTVLTSNCSIATISSNTSPILDRVHLNALVGQTNGTSSGGSKNYYCHQLSLCLDNNDLSGNVTKIGATNIYFKAQIEENAITMRSLLENYIVTLASTASKVEEYYEGSKLNPNIVTMDNASKMATIMASNKETANQKLYFLLTGNDQNVSNDLFGNETVNLVSSHVFGDGLSIITTHQALFNTIDQESKVSGIRVMPYITTSSYATLNEKTGIGALANVNSGYIFACNAQTIDISVDVNITASGANYVGGLVGINDGVIVDCFASLRIDADCQSGGLIGYNTGLVISSYSTCIILSENSFAFCDGSANGQIVNSYTASSASSGVFGQCALKDSYYDLYATSCVNANQDLETALATNQMSVISKFENPGETDEKLLFFENDSSVKFSYNDAMNFGYPVFTGTQYVTLNYMNGVATGDGQETSKKLIHTLGRLQMLNYLNTADVQAKLNFQIINDLIYNPDLKTAYDEIVIDESSVLNTDFKVVSWEPINNFIGTLTGAYASGDDQYIISNLSSGEESSDWSIFYNLKGAKIEYLTITSTNKDLKITNTSFASLALKATKAIIDHVKVEFDSIEYNGSSENTVLIGGLVSETTNDGEATATIISNCEIAIGKIDVSNPAVKSITVGGVVGSVVGKTYIGTNADDASVDVKFTKDEFTITSKAKSNNIGIIAGTASNLTTKNITLKNVNISTTTEEKGGENNVGVLFGTSSNSTIKDMTIEDVEISINSEEENGITTNNIGLVSGTSSIGLAKTVTLNSGKIEVKNGKTNNVGIFAGTSTSDTLQEISTLSDKVTISTEGATMNNIGVVAGKYDSTKQTEEENDTEKNREVSDIKIGEVEISTTSATTDNLGGVVGNANGFVTGKGGISTGKITITSSASSKANLGGLFGTSTGCAVTKGSFGGDITLVLNGDGELRTGAYSGSVTGASNFADAFNVGSTKIVSTHTLSEDAENTGSANYIGSFFGMVESTGATEDNKVKISLTSLDTSNLTFTLDEKSSGKNYIGGIAGKAKGLKLINGQITGSSGFTISDTEGENIVGAIAGEIDNSYISSVTVSGFNLNQSDDVVNTTKIGVLASTISSSTLTSVTVSGCSISNSKDVSETTYIGGFAGEISSSTLNDCMFAESEIKSKDIKVSTEPTEPEPTEPTELEQTEPTESTEPTEPTETTQQVFCYAGGLAGIISTTKINKATLSTPTISIGKGVAGGVAGDASGTAETPWSSLDLTAVKVIETTNYEYSNSMPTTSDSVAGGVVGEASGALTMNNVQVNGQVSATFVAGGIVGKGSFAEISGAINSAVVNAGLDSTVKDNIAHYVSYAYAGGIVGILSGGLVSVSQNNGAVSAGVENSIGEKITQRDLYWWEYGNKDDEDAENGDTKMRNKIDDLKDNINKNQTGQTSSYAAGIIGYSEIVPTADDASAIVDGCANNGGATISANAKIVLDIEMTNRIHLGISTDQRAYYVSENEPSYASGIINFADNVSETIDMSTNENLGMINGGTSAEYNIFSTDYGDLANRYASYILDYTFANGKYESNSFVSLYDPDSVESSDHDKTRDGLTTWYKVMKEYSNIKLVGVDKNKCRIGNTYNYELTGCNSNNENLTDYDSGRMIYYYMNDDQRVDLHYNNLYIIQATMCITPLDEEWAVRINDSGLPTGDIYYKLHKDEFGSGYYFNEHGIRFDIEAGHSGGEAEVYDSWYRVSDGLYIGEFSASYTEQSFDTDLEILHDDEPLYFPVPVEQGPQSNSCNLFYAPNISSTSIYAGSLSTYKNSLVRCFDLPVCSSASEANKLKIASESEIGYFDGEDNRIESFTLVWSEYNSCYVIPQGTYGAFTVGNITDPQEGEIYVVKTIKYVGTTTHEKDYGNYVLSFENEQYVLRRCSSPTESSE